MQDCSAQLVLMTNTGIHRSSGTAAVHGTSSLVTLIRSLSASTVCIAAYVMHIATCREFASCIDQLAQAAAAAMVSRCALYLSSAACWCPTLHTSQGAFTTSHVF
jgi:hypothetical protein